MDTPELIYCADGNPRFAKIAIEAGFRYGARLPAHGLAFPIYFADQDWKHPDRVRYMAALAKHKPYMASVLDWERADQLPEVLGWAEEAAHIVEVVVVVPKVHQGIVLLPARIGGKEVRLGYSVPTAYGGTDLFLSEFVGWPVHLLGGSPKKQIELSRYLDVRSVDGNMHHKMACRYGAFFTVKRLHCRNYPWPTLKEADGQAWGKDVIYEAFRRSCVNIWDAWHGKG
jgi:hypothetical protein